MCFIRQSIVFIEKIYLNLQDYATTHTQIKNT